MKSLLQTKEWATLRQGYGWQAYNIDEISVLGKKLPFGKGFLYVPEVSLENIKNLDIFLQNIRNIAQKNKAIFTRLEILDKIDNKIIQKLKDFHFQKSFEEVQPEWRQIIDITCTEAEILAQMKEKGRYNIKVAQRNNIVIERCDPSTSLGVNEFYQIFQETAKRDGFEIRPRQYFQNLLDILTPPGFVELLVAKYNNKVIAAEIVTYFDTTASYLYGASSNENRNLMAPYLLHFETIRRAKAKGCRIYDLLAVNPEGTENHKYAGIGRFKRQFGGETVQIVGSWDLVYKPTWYKMFKIAERYRRK